MPRTSKRYDRPWVHVARARVRAARAPRRRGFRRLGRGACELSRAGAAAGALACVLMRGEPAANARAVARRRRRGARVGAGGGRARHTAGGRGAEGGGGRDARRERSRSPAHERSPARARACTRKRGVGVGGAVAARAGFSWRARRAPLPGWGKGLGGEPRQRWMDARGARRPRRPRVQQAQSLTRLGALVGARCWARPTAP